MDARLKAVHNKLSQFYTVHGVPFAPTHDAEVATAWIEGALDINKNMRKGFQQVTEVIRQPDGLRGYLSALEFEEQSDPMDDDGERPPQGRLHHREVIGPSDEPRSTLWSRDGLIENMGKRQERQTGVLNVQWVDNAKSTEFTKIATARTGTNIRGTSPDQKGSSTRSSDLSG